MQPTKYFVSDCNNFKQVKNNDYISIISECYLKKPSLVSFVAAWMVEDFGQIVVEITT